MIKRALVTGITGQCGSYLAELLLKEGYEVHGIIRRSSSFNTDRIEHLYTDPHERTKLYLHYGDMTDGMSLRKILDIAKPELVFNLAAQSHVRVSFDCPEYTTETIVMGTIRLLEAIREYEIRTGIKVKFYQASSSEMFGKVMETPQKETTPFYPRSPYACAKACAFWQTKNYRESYGMFICNGILFNNEGPRRGPTFVTRKITMAVAKIKAGLQNKLFLGNIDARRDWGYSKEYVKAMYLMLQQQEPDDYVIATGETHTVRDFLDVSFTHVGLDWKEYVEIDKRYMRPTEVDLLLGDASKAKKKLKWEPQVNFETLVKMMTEADLRAIGITCDTSPEIECLLQGERVLDYGKPAK